MTSTFMDLLKETQKLDVIYFVDDQRLLKLYDEIKTRLIGRE